MKHSILLLIAGILFLQSCSDKEHYKITGQIQGIEDAKVYIGTKDYEGQYEIKPIDSARITDGKFSFKGSVEVPSRRYIKVKHELGSIPFFLENSTITIKTTRDKYPEAEISGSKSQNVYEKYLSEKKKYEKKILSVKKAMKNEKDSSAALKKEYRKAYNDMITYTENFLLSDTSSSVRLFAFKHSRVMYPLKVLDSLYHSLDTNLYSTPQAQKLNQRINNLKKVQPGKQYINLTLQDTSGNQVALSDYVGNNYVLLYFVRLCPHTKLMPEGLKKLYKDYHTKGLQLFGVYTEKDPYYWKETIRKHNIEWPFVSDLKGKQSEAYKKYGSWNTPYYYLINKKGKFAGRFRTIDKTEDKLNEILIRHVQK
jgi:peroxiredoxin